jgi:hypothetical protein
MKLGIASSIRSPAPAPVAPRVFVDKRRTPVAAEFIRARAERRARALVIPCDVVPNTKGLSR